MCSDRHQKLSYKATPGDEVEDMYELLKEVKQKIPSIEAVSSRAITSDYQGLLVESVCSRLGLVSLAYLWKQDQSMLLQEKIDNGILAIMVKVLLGTGGMIFPAWLLLYVEFGRTCLHMQVIEEAT
ncbi:diphthine--ammonia ligase-like isoform X1 [Eucalyptus grandis]|uniref:diphthine--ammonia ligase-like isoform X1 n=1 Tax=Eucalyptus grandis TaxID=71139 RepID=UPI00192E96D7|nr:diphthine--ammonia ligase-like isoform X1 [Eucalyptus grandis]